MVTTRPLIRGVGVSEIRQLLQLGASSNIPRGGRLQLGGAGHALAPLRMGRAGTIVGASVQVSPQADTIQSYDVEIHRNGVLAATLPLPAGSLGASTTSLSVPVVVGDVITVWMGRTSGTPDCSKFDEIQVILEFQVPS